MNKENQDPNTEIDDPEAVIDNLELSQLLEEWQQRRHFFLPASCLSAVHIIIVEFAHYYGITEM